MDRESAPHRASLERAAETSPLVGMQGKGRVAPNSSWQLRSWLVGVLVPKLSLGHFLSGDTSREHGSQDSCLAQGRGGGSVSWKVGSGLGTETNPPRSSPCLHLCAVPLGAWCRKRSRDPDEAKSGAEPGCTQTPLAEPWWGSPGEAGPSLHSPGHIWSWAPGPAGCLQGEGQRLESVTQHFVAGLPGV